MTAWDRLNTLTGRGASVPSSSGAWDLIDKLNAGTPPSAVAGGSAGGTGLSYPPAPTYPAPRVAQPGTGGSSATTSGGGGAAGLLGGWGALDWGVKRITGKSPTGQAVDWLKGQWNAPKLAERLSYDPWAGAQLAAPTSPGVFGADAFANDLAAGGMMGGYGPSVDDFARVLDAQVVEGAGEAGLDAINATDGVGALNSPWLSVPGAALALYNFAKDPSFESGLGAGVSGVQALASFFPSLFPAGFTAAPFALPLIAMSLGKMLDPANRAPGAGFHIDPSGKLVDRGVSPGVGASGKFTPQMQKLHNDIMAEVNRRGGMKYLEAPAPDGMTWAEIDDLSSRGVGVMHQPWERQPYFEYVFDEGEPDDVTVNLLQHGSGYESIYSGRNNADVNAIVDAIMSRWTPEALASSRESALADVEMMRLAQADPGH